KALVEANALIARGRLKHQYPHSWRSKKPVIFRNTPQWFIAMDKPLRPISLSPSSRGEGRGEGRPQAGALASAPHPNPLPAKSGERGPVAPGTAGNRPLRAIALPATADTQLVRASGRHRL